MRACAVYFTPRMLLVMTLSFASGLPLALTASTLSAWLAESSVDKTSIGLFAAIATPYAFKFLWSPFIDGLSLPLFTRIYGRRRGWMVAIQLLLMAAIAAMAFASPALDPWWTACAGLVVATLSASQDIVIDAYRVEFLPPEEQGQGAAMTTLGYRLGMLASGAGALALADTEGWHATYLIMAALMAVGVAATLLARESVASCELRVASISSKLSHTHTPTDRLPATNNLQLATFFHDHILAPFKDFMTRPLWWQVLLFVALYKLADAFMGIMFTPFLLEIGFTKTQIATIVKLYGLAATLAGTFIGGALVARWGMFRTLFLCGVAHMFTNLMLVVQARLGAHEPFLIASIVLENATGGMSSAAFLAYLAHLCKVNYTATQYALLSSLAAAGRTWLSTPSGWVAKTLGWEMFFAFAALLALPGLALVWWLEKKSMQHANLFT